MDSPESPKDQPPQIAQPKLPGWGWLILLIALLIWNVMTFRPVNRPEITIPYSEFLAQVRAGNVASVKIVGAEISGEFHQPITWPVATLLPDATGATAQPTPQTVTAGEFRTTFPATVGDAQLMPLLESQQIKINASEPATPWWTLLLTNGLPVLLLIGVMFLMTRRMVQSPDSVLDFGRSRARKTAGDRPEVTFRDVAGADEAKQDLEDVVDFLREPEKYHRIGARIPRGVLLVGPPGTGKTLMARAVSGEAHVPFYNLSASEFVEMFVGVGASRVRDLFKQAKDSAPAIIFIDELDAVGRRRGAGVGMVNDEREQTLNQLLVEMDGFDQSHEVIVLAATNRPDVLDPALLRPGRFDRQVTLNMPDRTARLGILHIHTRNLPLAEDVDLDVLARSTTGFSGADLANLANEAALVAARNDEERISMGCFEAAMDKIVLGDVRPLLLDDQQRRTIAYHEGGHALVAWLTPDADPVHKITIIPRGRALGVTEQLPEQEQYNYSRRYLLARLAVMLGGRSAEEVVMGDITTGAENDLVEATQLARRMMTRWAMGSLGPVAFKADEEQPFLGYSLSQGRDYSEATAAQIDQNVRELLQERHLAATSLLKKNRRALDALAERLLRDETVSSDALVEIVGERPESGVLPVGAEPVGPEATQ